jgi:Rieske Fe-S protein
VRKQRNAWFWLLGLVFLAVVGMIGTSVLAIQTPPMKLAINTLGLPDVSAHRVASVAVKAPRGGYRPTRIFLVRSHQGWWAFSNRSTHLGEPVEWREEYDRFVDVYSFAMWDKSGRPVAGPAPRGLDGYEVTMDGDYVIIDLSRPVLGQP